MIPPGMFRELFEMNSELRYAIFSSLQNCVINQHPRRIQPEAPPYVTYMHVHGLHSFVDRLKRSRKFLRFSPEPTNQKPPPPHPKPLAWFSGEQLFRDRMGVETARPETPSSLL